MNELKDTQVKDLQQSEQTSEGKKTTSQELPETLTREQAQKLIHDAETNIGSKLGRELKASKLEAEQYKSAHSKLETELNETREKMSEIQRRIDEAEEEEAKGSTESMKLYQRQKQLRETEVKLRDKERQLEKERQEHASEIAMAKEAKTEMMIVSVAVEHHIDISKLKEKVQKLGLTTEEQIFELAETMAGQVEENNGKKKVLIPKGDSGNKLGGNTEDSLKQRYPSMFR